MRVEAAPEVGWPRPEAATPWSSADVWTVPGLIIPAAKQTTTLRRRGKLQGADLELEALAGPGSRLASIIPGDMEHRFPVVRVLLYTDRTTARRRYECLVFARDERGMLYGVPQVDEFHSPDTTITGDYWLRLPPRTRKIDLLVVIHRHRFVEFLVPNPFLNAAKRPAGAPAPAR
jgi:hypothetical protein